MKNTLIKTVGIITLTIGGLVSTSSVAFAKEEKSIVISAIQDHGTSKELQLNVLSTKDAVEEPQSSINARNKSNEDAKNKANKVAEAEKNKLIKQAEKKWHDDYPKTGQEFIDAISKDAIAVSGEFDLYPSVLIAQAAHESTFGTSGLGAAPHHNLFGIKGTYKGGSVVMRTWEEYGGKPTWIDARFRAYPSWKQSMEDYADLLVNGISGSPQFYAGTWRSNASTNTDAVNALVGKYATDSAYAVRLNEMIQRYDLSRFDSVEALDTSKITVKPIVKKTKLPKDSYVVKKDNTLQSIAVDFDVAVRDIVELNKMDKVAIHVNQVIKIPAKKAEKKESLLDFTDTAKKVNGFINSDKLVATLKNK